MMPDLKSLPPLNLSAPLNLSNSSSAKGGEFFGGAGKFQQGDWIVSTGSGDAGLSTKTLLLFGAVGLGALWLKHKKTT